MGFSILQETGRPVEIRDEGVTLIGNVESIDFTGDGISGTIIGSDITENVPQGGHTIKDDGGALTQRANLNFIGMTVADNAGTNSTDVTGSSGGAWGSITGTLSAQTDLQAELDTKLETRVGVYRTIWIPASAMTPRVTNGAAGATEEYATSDIMSEHFLFDGATEEGVQFTITMPDEWNLLTIKAKFFWDASTGASAADGVTWGISAQAQSNDDAVDTAFGASIDTDDVVIAVGDLHVSPASASVTVSGTPALGDMVRFEITRVVGDAQDDMTEDAKLFGISIQFLESSTEPSAW